jgi:hypothetical protein
MQDSDTNFIIGSEPSAFYGVVSLEFFEDEPSPLHCAAPRNENEEENFFD